MSCSPKDYSLTEAPLVSVIMPAYNSERHIAEAIASVQAQSVKKWELCITDDCSYDHTTKIIRKMSENDSRIRYVKQPSNQGAAKARNEALNRARGRYIAYLDADDIWYPEKLERQIEFMSNGNHGFSCTSYEVINEDGKPLGRTITMPDKSDWWGYLTNNYLQTVGIMADLQKVDRSLLIMPDAKREDAATWVQVLNAGHTCYGISNVLCAYRRTDGSLSSNHAKAALGTWQFYRKYAGLPLHKAIYCFVRYAILAVWKRTYPRHRDS